MKNIKIRPGLNIGDYGRAFIIAEIGSNWRGLNDCLFSIEKAKQCGADAVKFQAYNSQALYGVPIWGGKLATEKDYKALPIQGELPLDWLPELKEKADQMGVEFMCSAFSPELIDAVDPYVNIHKLASAEMCHVRMLEKLNDIGKPVFMSTGAHTVDEIRESLKILGQHTTPLVLMYCVANYPAQEIDLSVMNEMHHSFDCLVGFSDHTLDIAFIPMKACKVYGASVIEKHVNFIPDLSSPDSAHSLSADKFRKMVDSIRDKRESRIGPVSEEMPMIQRHNRRLIATKDIKEGEELIEANNFGAYRSLTTSANAISPFRISEVEGKKAKREIKAGQAICPEDY